MSAKALIRPLEGRIALVTGASRGIGKGIALQLGQAGCTVYISGRKPGHSFSSENTALPSLEQTAKENRGGTPVVVYCDHANTNDVEKLFNQINVEKNGQLDILKILENAGKKFFESEPTLWDDMNEVGLRNSYFCSVYSARMMVKRRSGLIVNISSAGALQYFFNIDRMSADMALELKDYGVNVVSLWPGFTKTELTQDVFSRNDGTLSKATNIPLVHLASDKHLTRKSGKVLLTTDLATEYGYVDVNGKMPPNMRSVSSALEFFGWTNLAKLFPAFIKVPKQALHFGSYKF